MNVYCTGLNIEESGIRWWKNGLDKPSKIWWFQIRGASFGTTILIFAYVAILVVDPFCGVVMILNRQKSSLKCQQSAKGIVADMKNLQQRAIVGKQQQQQQNDSNGWYL